MSIVMRFGAIPVLLAFAIAAASAHPMGNFSVSHYMKFDGRSAQLRMTYALDLAEIPTFEMTHQWGMTDPSSSEIEKRASLEMKNWVSALRMTANGQPLRPRIESIRSHVTDGAGGMPVVRVAAILVSPMPDGPLSVAYTDPNFQQRSGWKEIVVHSSGDRSVARTSGTSAELSYALTRYPEDPATTPPQSVTASIEWNARRPLPVVAPDPSVPTPVPDVAPQPAAAPAASGSVTKGDFLSKLLSRTDLSFSLALAGLAVAFGIGAMHAMSPGHGKTLMAAYLVGSRGTLKHAAILGSVVTFTHTVSVFLLGLATLFLSQYFLPEKIVPWMGAISGATIVLVGLSLFWKRLALLLGREPAGHSHFGHSHPNDHGDGLEHSHDGASAPHSHAPQGEITMASLVALGVSGGLVPCPSALVILLSSIAIGRTSYGLLLLLAFSVGLSLVLMAVGAAVLYAKNLIPSTSRFAESKPFRLLPVLSAAVIVCVGVFMTGASMGMFPELGS